MRVYYNGDPGAYLLMTTIGGVVDGGGSVSLVRVVWWLRRAGWCGGFVEDCTAIAAAAKSFTFFLFNPSTTFSTRYSDFPVPFILYLLLSNMTLIYMFEVESLVYTII